MAKCEVCFRHCEIPEGGRGFCGARGCREGRVVPLNYGRLTALALDPIEKKPLRRFFPGTKILSVGSYGCNLRCPFCQNSEISWGDEAKLFAESADTLTPEQLVHIAKKYRTEGNIGIAFTYNEPLVGYEFVRDTARLSHVESLKNVLVTNGSADIAILQEIAPFIDAMNIDLKGFTETYYHDVLGGNIEMTKQFIEEAVKHCHVELTTLIVPGENDSKEEIRALSTWVSELRDADGNRIGPDIPLHISRFFPRFHMTDCAATPVSRVYELADIARENLNYVYTGNC